MGDAQEWKWIGGGGISWKAHADMKWINLRPQTGNSAEYRVQIPVMPSVPWDNYTFPAGGTGQAWYKSTIDGAVQLPFLNSGTHFGALKSANFTAEKGVSTPVANGSPRTVTPPPNPARSDWFTITKTQSSGSDVTIDFVSAGENFMSVSTNYVMGAGVYSATFRYVGDSAGWLMTAKA